MPKTDATVDNPSARAVLVTVVFALAAAAQGVIFALRRIDLGIIEAVAYRNESLYDPEDGLVYTFVWSFGLDAVVVLAMASAWLFWLAGVARRARARGDAPPSFSYSLPVAALLHVAPIVDVAGPWLTVRAFAADLPARARRLLGAFSLAWGAGHLAAFTSLFLVHWIYPDAARICPEMSRPEHRRVNYCHMLLRAMLDVSAASLVLVAAVLGIAAVWSVRAAQRRD